MSPSDPHAGSSGHPPNPGSLSRRTFGRIGAAAALTGLLAATGCGRGSSNRLRIAYYGDTGQNEAMAAALSAISADDPDLNAAREPGSFTGYYDKLSTRLGAGSAPDVVMNDFTHLAGYAERGALLDLAGYVPDPIDTSIARPTAFDGGRSGDRLFGVPIGTHTQALLVDHHLVPGVDIAELTRMTWDRYAEIAAGIGGEGGGTVFGVEDGGGKDFGLDIWVRQRGGQLFTEGRALGFSQDDLADWFDFWDRLRRNGGAVPIDITVDPTVQPLVTGAAAFGFSFSSYSGTQDQTDARLTLLPLPAVSTSDRPGAYQYVKPTNLYSINADSDHRRRAVELAARFLTDPDVGAALGTTLGSPPAQPVFDRMIKTASGVDKAILTFDAMIQRNATATDYPPPRPIGADQLLTATGALLTRLNQSIAYRQLTPSQGAAQFFDQARSYLQP